MVTVLYYVVCGWVCMWTSASLVTGMDPQTRLHITDRIRKLKNTVNTQQVLIDNLKRANTEQDKKLEALELEIELEVRIVNTQQKDKVELEGITGHANHAVENLLDFTARSMASEPETGAKAKTTREEDNASSLDAIEVKARLWKSVTHINNIHNSSIKSAAFYPRTPTYRYQYQMVGFSALQYTSQVVPRNGIVHFDHELVNFRGSYDVMKGVFMSPLKGIYVFSVSISSSNNSTCKAEIVKNGAGLGVVDADSVGRASLTDQGSITIVTSLDEGDRVMVRSLLHNHLLGGYRDTLFSGALVSELP